MKTNLFIGALLVICLIFACCKKEEKPVVAVEEQQKAAEVEQKKEPEKTKEVIILPSCAEATIPGDFVKLADKKITPEEKIKTLNRLLGECLECGKGVAQCKDIKETINNHLLEMKIKDPFVSADFAINIVQIDKKMDKEKNACTIAKGAFRRWKELKNDAMIYCLKDEDTANFIKAAAAKERQVDPAMALNDLNHFEWVLLLCKREEFWKPGYCSDVGTVYTDYIERNKALFNSQHYIKAIYVLGWILGDIEKSLVYAEEAAKKWPENGDIFNLLVDGYKSANKIEKAEGLLRERVKSAPNENIVKLKLISLLLNKAKDMDSAEIEALLGGITAANDFEKDLLAAYKAWLMMEKGDCDGANKIIASRPKCKVATKDSGFAKAILLCNAKNDKRIQQKIDEIKKKKEKKEKSKK